MDNTNPFFRETGQQSRSLTVSVELTLDQFNIFLLAFRNRQQSGPMENLLDRLRAEVAADTRQAATLADLAKIDRGQFSRFMKGTSGLSVRAVERLAEQLRLEIVLRPVSPVSPESKGN